GFADRLVVERPAVDVGHPDRVALDASGELSLPDRGAVLVRLALEDDGLEGEGERAAGDARRAELRPRRRRAQVADLARPLVGRVVAAPAAPPLLRRLVESQVEDADLAVPARRERVAQRDHARLLGLADLAR